MIRMKWILTWLMIPLLHWDTYAQSTRFDVSSLAEFNAAHDVASAGDSIVWTSGTYSNVFMDISKDGLIVTAAVSGTVIFNGASRVEIDGDHVILSAMQFIGGNIGTDHAIRIWGDEVLITQINIANYTCYKYLIVDEDAQRATISYSNFENRLNLDDQNILSVLVDENEPGYHKIQYCSFKNFEGTGNDLGIEPIRIGVSTQAEFDSRTIVEYCYFTHCDGDGELISNKASQNVIRYNTFENNSKAELVLRHGDEAIVYGNFFLNNMGGVRVREGANHFIYNNYFEGLDRRTIFLQNESSDPLSDIHIYFNTIVNSAAVILGGDGGSNPPTHVTIANNIFADPDNQLFEDATGNETWLGNLSHGALGIGAQSGITATDPELSLNDNGFYQMTDTSPAIDHAVSGYPAIPKFEGLTYDAEVAMDLMRQVRPDAIHSKDVGAVEYSESLSVRPHVTEENTGPFYLNELQTVAVNIADVEGGEIVLSPPFDEYIVSSVISATAIPDAGYQFSNWSGDLEGSENPIQFVVSEGMEISAAFTPSVLGTLSGQSIHVYPNPSNGYLIIEWPFDKVEIVSVRILALNGQVFLDEEIQITTTSQKAKLHISALSGGAYLLQLTPQPGSAFYQMKFIKH